MSYSIPPLVNYLVWLGLRNRVDTLDGENAVYLNRLENGLKSSNTVTLKNNATAVKAQMGSWVAVISISTLALILYAPVLVSLVGQWWDDPNYGHGFFVPVFVAYVLWSERDRWREATYRSQNVGLAVILLAIALRVLGMLGAELFTARLSLVIMVAGIVLFFAGRQVLRSIAFPVGYLLFMIPLPAIIYYQLTLPLQLWASRLGATGLVAIGIHTVRQGNLLLLPNCTLNVVEACSGIRSLLSLVAAVVAYGYLAEPSTWKRTLLAFASIPIAIATNGLRLVATGALSYYFGPSVDSGAVHLALGIGFFALAFLSIVLTNKILGLRLRYRNPAADSV